MFVSRRMIHIGLAGAVVAAGVGTYLSLQSSPAASTSARTVTASKGSVISDVTATGSASSSKQLNLSFQSSGVLSSVDVHVGEHVHAGQVLATLQNTTEQDAVTGAEQSLASAEAKVAKAEAGTTATTLLQDEIATQSAERTTDDAVAGLARDQATAKMDTTQQTASVTQAKQAVTNAKVNATIDATDQEASVSQAEEAVANAKENATIDATQEAEDVAQAKRTLSGAQQKLSDDEEALGCAEKQVNEDGTDEYPSATCPYTPTGNPTHLSSDKAAVVTDQQAVTNDELTVQNDTAGVTNAEYAETAAAEKDDQSIESAENALTNAENTEISTEAKDTESIKSAENALTNAENSAATTELKDSQTIQSDEEQIQSDQLNQESTTASNAAKQKTTATAIAADQQSVDSAQQSLASAQQSLDDTILTAPVTGTVAAVNGVVGETPGSGSSSTSSGSGSSGSSGFVTLTDLSSLQVVADFAESTVAKIELGQKATISFSALPNEDFSGSVSSIAVSSTTVSNVVEYGVTVSITGAPSSLKPGMTATVSVTTAKVDGVVTLPSTAISTKGSAAVVEVVESDGKRESRVVTVGLRGNTEDEITSGLAPGDKVVVSQGSSTSSASGGSPFFKGAPGGAGGFRIGGA
jgi:HlyD family secretion protein